MCSLFKKYFEGKAWCRSYHSAYVYTHPGGYRIKLRLELNEWLVGQGTHVSAIILVQGKYDNKLKFPARFTVTLELLNQHRDKDHYRQDIQCHQEERIVLFAVQECGSCTKFIPHADLEWNESKQIQYLKNDCLKFRMLTWSQMRINKLSACT